jgi:histone H2B
MAAVNDILCDTFRRVMHEAKTLGDKDKKYVSLACWPISLDRKIMTSREVQTSVRLYCPGEIAKHAVSEGMRNASGSLLLLLCFRSHF